MPMKYKAQTSSKNATMENKPVEWADLFPEMEAHATKDPRVFQTPFKIVSKGSGLMDGIKQKTYFCCIVGGNCYGVEVFRQMAVRADKECTEAFEKVKIAADYYETHGKWPIN